jgi:hypothetical protein
MTDANAEQLRREFKSDVAKAMAEQGNTFSPSLRPKYKERGLSDPAMDKLISEVMYPG